MTAWHVKTLLTRRTDRGTRCGTNRAANERATAGSTSVRSDRSADDGTSHASNDRAAASTLSLRRLRRNEHG
jgi:hypothetical protein